MSATVLKYYRTLVNCNYIWKFSVNSNTAIWSKDNCGSNNSFISYFFVLNINFSDCSLHSTTNKFFLQYVSPDLWQHHHTWRGAKKTAARDVIVTQKECKDSPQLKYFERRLLDDEELRIVHQARLPQSPSTFNARFRGLLIVPQCSLSTIAGLPECWSAKNQNVENYIQQTAS